jgi:hypothetical protein
MGETPEGMSGFSVICNEFPSLLSSLLRFFAALYPFGANRLPGKFAQRAQISTDCGTEKANMRIRCCACACASLREIIPSVWLAERSGAAR